MIVISGVLVLVAIALLIGGLASSGLGLVWASIAVSLLSAVFLAVGVYQRRNEVPALDGGATGGGTGDDDLAGVRTVAAASSASAGTSGAEPVETDNLSAEAVTAGGTVLVVVGRPRYHVEGCRYLAGKSTEERDVTAALDEGYSPCGVCKPDAALATLGATYGDESDGADETEATSAADADVDTDVTATSILSEDPAPATKRTAAKKTAAKKTAATKTAATKSAATKTAAKKTAAAGTAGGAAKSARAVPMVVAVADRGKFHRSECRFASAAGAEEMPKAAAKRKGLTACGVCKP